MIKVVLVILTQISSRICKTIVRIGVFSRSGILKVQVQNTDRQRVPSEPPRTAFQCYHSKKAGSVETGSLWKKLFNVDPGTKSLSTAALGNSSQ